MNIEITTNIDTLGGFIVPEGSNSSPTGQSTKIGKPTQANYKVRQPKAARVTQMHGCAEYHRAAHKPKPLGYLRALRSAKGLSSTLGLKVSS